MLSLFQGQGITERKETAMLSIYATVHYASATDGWTEEEFDALDVLDTEANLTALLTEEVRRATGVDNVTVEVRSDDAGDVWVISGARDALERNAIDETVRNVLIDFPWHDAQYWAIFK